MHVACEPAILYFGTPVVLISTVNEDGSFNLAPMSSAFWLGWRCMIGLGSVSKTAQNIIRTGQCVLNLPSSDQAAMVDRLALTTGSDPVPPHKEARGYRYEKEKFTLAGFTPAPSQTVKAPRALQCPVQMEAVLERIAQRRRKRRSLARAHRELRVAYPACACRALDPDGGAGQPDRSR